MDLYSHFLTENKNKFPLLKFLKFNFQLKKKSQIYLKWTMQMKNTKAKFSLINNISIAILKSYIYQILIAIIILKKNSIILYIK